MATRAMWTYADYAALPEDGRRYQLYEGELVVTPAPGTRHQGIIVNLTVLLHPHVKALGLGQVLVAPTDCILSDVTVLQPDLVFIATADLARMSARAIEGAPTLAVEVLSPSTAGRDQGRERGLHARHGVPWYWIVDPDRRVIEAWRGSRAPGTSLPGVSPGQRLAACPRSTTLSSILPRSGPEASKGPASVTMGAVCRPAPPMTGEGS